MNKTQNQTKSKLEGKKQTPKPVFPYTGTITCESYSKPGKDIANKK